MDVQTALNMLFLSFVTMFTIMNPVGATPFFLTHTENLPLAQMKSTARRASFASFLVLAVFSFFGTHLFKLLGISLPAFRIAGGILVFSAAWEMLKGSNIRSRTLPEEQRDAISKEDISIIPLAIPLISGPGAISTIMVMEARAQSYLETALLILAAGLASLATYYILTQSNRLLNFLGQSGIRVMTRILGLLLSAISIQFMINGLKDVLPEVVHIIQSVSQ